MEPSDIRPLSTDKTAAADSNDSSRKKSGDLFIEEKRILQKKNAGKNVVESPAPFYDELHFANYE